MPGSAAYATANKTTHVESADPKNVDDVKSNLPLPEQPPVASDWQSADARNVNVGSGEVQSDISTGDATSAGLREPASKSNPIMSGIGRQGKDNLESAPKDAKSS